MGRIKHVAKRAGKRIALHSESNSEDASYSPSASSPSQSSSSRYEIEGGGHLKCRKVISQSRQSQSLKNTEGSSNMKRKGRTVSHHGPCFFKFRKYYQDKCKAENPSKNWRKVDYAQISKDAGEVWKKMSETEKQPFKDEWEKEEAEREKNAPKEAPKQKKNQNHWHRCSIDQFVKCVSQLGAEKIKAIEEIGFGQLLNLKCTRLDRNLFHYIFSNFDYHTGLLRVGLNEYISISAHDVNSIFGLPCGETDVPEGSDFEAEWINNCGFRSPGGMHINALQDKVTQLDVGDDFKRAFVLFACATVLRPNGRSIGHLRGLESVNKVDSIRTYNWYGYTYKHLVEPLKKPGKERQSWTGCLIFLQLLYLIRVDVKWPGKGDVQSVSFWTDENVKKRLQWEAKMGGFGHGQACPTTNCTSGHEVPVSDYYSSPSHSTSRMINPTADTSSDSEYERCFEELKMQLQNTNKIFKRLQSIRERRREKRKRMGQFCLSLGSLLSKPYSA